MATCTIMATFAAGTLEEPKWAGKLAKEYPFTLDPFQVGNRIFDKRFTPLLADFLLF